MQLLRQARERQTSAEGCAGALLDALPPVLRFVRHHMRRHRNRGLSLPQFRVLTLLLSAPSANLSAVADFLVVSLPTASRIVSGLVAKGLIIRRQCCSDRRQVELALTARGAAIVSSANQTTLGILARELDSLPPADLRALLRGTRALHSVFSPKLRNNDHAAKSAMA